MRRGAGFERGATLLLGAACGLLSSSAAAQPTGVPPPGQEERVRVTYLAPAGCPTEAEFQERVSSRVQRAQFAAPGELARVFDVTIAIAAEASFSGRLEFVDADGRRASRSLKGPGCDELASSLALITALAIDDRIAEAPPDAASPEPSPPPVATRSPNPKTNDELKAPARLPEPPDRSLPTRRRLSWELGVNGGVLSWITGSIAPELGLYAELRSPIPSWSVRLSAFDARRSKSNPDLGSADFAADWLRLEACPLAVVLPAHFALSPCAAFDAGRLQATAQSSSPDAHNLFWAAGTALARLSWVYRERLVVGWDAELGLPFRRQNYDFRNPNGTLLSLPSWGLGTKFGVGLRFP